MITTKQRAYLRGLAQNLDPVFQIGKNSLTPEFTEAIIENLEKHELLKISVLKNCDDEPKELAGILADRTHSDVVSVTGRKIVIYRQAKDKDKRKIELPR